jgi:hypothetical protein
LIDNVVVSIIERIIGNVMIPLSIKYFALKCHLLLKHCLYQKKEAKRVRNICEIIILFEMPLFP